MAEWRVWRNVDEARADLVKHGDPSYVASVLEGVPLKLLEHGPWRLLNLFGCSLC